MANSDTHLYNRQESSFKLFPFIHIFNELWKSGETAYIDLNTHAGEAWINIRTPLGNYTNSHKYPQYPSFTNVNHTPQHHPNTTRSPSYLRRLQSRKLARAATNTLNESAEQVALNLTQDTTMTEKVIPKLNESAEQVALKITHNTTLTDKVITHHLTKGFSAEKVESLKTHNTILTDTSYADKLKLAPVSTKPNTAEFPNNTSESSTTLPKTTHNTKLTEKVIPQHPIKGYSTKPNTAEFPNTSESSTPLDKTTHNTKLTEKVNPQHPIKGYSAEKVESLKTNNTKLTDTNVNEAEKLKLTPDHATPNTAEILINTSESTILNTEISKMSPKSNTTIPTTPIKNTPVPLSTPLQHNSKFSTHTTKTYAEKHKHTTKTITPNTKTTTPSTETLKSSPKKPPKVTITPPPESITYTKKIGHIFKGGKKGTKNYYYI